MTARVTKLTIFRNRFTQAGRNANANISVLQDKNPGKPIYQRKLNNGKIGLLLSEENKSHFFIVDKKGVLAAANTESKNYLAGKLYNRVKEFYADFGLVLRKVEKSILKNQTTGQTEEKALKYWSIDGPVHTVVTSQSVRQSEFPATKIAKKLHPGVAQKFENPNGDVVYWEHYLKP